MTDNMPDELIPVYDALSSLVADASYGNGCNDHDLMNPENYKKCEQDIEDCKTTVSTFIGNHHRIVEAQQAEIERLRRIINNIECEIETEMSRAEHREKIAAMDYHDSEMNHQKGRWHCAYDLSKYLQTLSQTQKESE